MRRDRLIRDLVRDRILVTLNDGTGFQGLLDNADDRTVVLVDAEFLRNDQASVKVDGRVFLARERIAYIQRP